MNRVVKRINLLKLRQDNPLWETILGMTVPGWTAFRVFEQIKNYQPPKAETCRLDAFEAIHKVIMLMLYVDDVPVAWNVYIRRAESWNPELWLFTKPEHRNKGHQRYLLPISKKKFGASLETCEHNQGQIATFKYYHAPLKRS